ncbi:GrpB family protein [Paenibacillus barcinonensis]|uniref:GrpB family protein n=1 Tax=Paenibacillus barcinonensis TaxID=198119 RepID=UPI00209D3976|nr:GrpB family protein [Paenibacillus barcinonensis]
MNTSTLSETIAKIKNRVISKEQVMEDQWRIASYNPNWRTLFIELGLNLRNSLGNTALRIDHIGSTSIEGIDAKPIIDIQISVLDIDDELSFKPHIESLGFELRTNNDDKTKKYFREIPGTRRTHIHVRQAGSFGEQATLLFRDYLRRNSNDCTKYVNEKHRLMNLYKNDRPKL